MAHTRRYGLTFTLPYTLEKEGNWYIARAPIVHSVSQGRTQHSAENNLADAIALRLQRSLEQGKLSESLREFGFVDVRIGDQVGWVHPHQNEYGERTLRRSIFLRAEEPERPTIQGRQLPSNDLRWLVAWKASDLAPGSARTH